MSDDEVELGSQILVKYNVAEDTIHARIVCGIVGPNHYVILTPQGDFYAENYNHSDYLWTRYRATPDSVPYGVNPAHIHDFEDLPSESQLSELIHEADRIIARDHRQAIGRGQGRGRGGSGGSLDRSGSVLTKPPHQSIGAGSDGVVVADGQPPPSIKPTSGLAALAASLNQRSAPTTTSSSIVDTDSRGDCRVLAVAYDHTGARFRNFKDAVERCEEVKWPDWPVSGVMTTAWCLRFMLERGLTPIGWHTKWKSDGGLKDSDSTVIIHESLCRVIEVGCCYDQLDVSALASFELIVRQIQICEEKLKDRFVSKDNDPTSVVALMSGSPNRHQLCICPKLTDWIAEEIKKEASVMKEIRKAREERALQKPK